MDSDTLNTSRRRFLTVASLSAAALFSTQKSGVTELKSAAGGDASPMSSSSLTLNKSDTAVVFIDPQNDVLSETGLAWAAVRESLKENNTIENMERIFRAAKAGGFEVFISPHYFFPTDKGWKFKETLTNLLFFGGGSKGWKPICRIVFLSVDV